MYSTFFCFFSLKYIVKSRKEEKKKAKKSIVDDEVIKTDPTYVSLRAATSQGLIKTSLIIYKQSFL